MARGNSRTRRRLAKVKAETFVHQAFIADAFAERARMIDANVRSSHKQDPVSRALRGEGFTSTVVLVGVGGKGGRGTAQWGTTKGVSQKIAARDIEPEVSTVTVDTSIPVKPVFAKDQPLYPTDFKVSKETGKAMPKGIKRFSQK